MVNAIWFWIDLLRFHKDFSAFRNIFLINFNIFQLRNARHVSIKRFWWNCVSLIEQIEHHTRLGEAPRLLSERLTSRGLLGTPLKNIVLWCTGEFQCGPQLGPPWCREMPVSRTAVRLIAVVFPDRTSCVHTYEKNFLLCIQWKYLINV